MGEEIVSDNKYMAVSDIHSHLLIQILHCEISAENENNLCEFCYCGKEIGLIKK